VNRSRLAVTGLAVLASLTFLSGCTATPSTSATTTPKTATEILNDAAAKTNGQSFKYTVTYGDMLSGDGSRDAAGANTQRNVTVKTGTNGLTIVAKVLHVGDKVYVKLDLGAFGSFVPGLGGVGDRWLLINTAKLNANGLSASLIPNADSSTIDAYIKGVVTAETVSATEIKGTVDISKSAPVALPASELNKLTSEQKVVPFTATLDDQGRVIKTVINMPAVAGYPAAPLTTTYTDYGAAITIGAPAESDVVAAPDTLYLILP
jgi:hypothetical protein